MTALLHTPLENRLVPRSNALGTTTDGGALVWAPQRTQCNYLRNNSAERSR